MALYATVTDAIIERSERGCHVVVQTLGGSRWAHAYTTTRPVAERLMARILTAGEIDIECGM